METNKLTELKPVFCDSIPLILEYGVIYISMKYGTAIHLCPCGCGHQSILALRPTFPGGWGISEKDGKITTRPSILNNPCRAHYYITDNKINWL